MEYNCIVKLGPKDYVFNCRAFVVVINLANQFQRFWAIHWK